MKINKEKLKEYAALNDRELWGAICEMAKKYGYALPEKVPSHAEMEKIRSLMTGDSRLSMSEAVRLLNQYKARR